MKIRAMLILLLLPAVSRAETLTEQCSSKCDGISDKVWQGLVDVLDDALAQNLSIADTFRKGREFIDSQDLKMPTWKKKCWIEYFRTIYEDKQRELVRQQKRDLQINEENEKSVKEIEELRTTIPRMKRYITDLKSTIKEKERKIDEYEAIIAEYKTCDSKLKQASRDIEICQDIAQNCVVTGMTVISDKVFLTLKATRKEENVIDYELRVVKAKQPIKAMKGTINFYDLFDTKRCSGQIEINETVQPGGSWTGRYTVCPGDGGWIRENGLGRIKMTFTDVQIVYADGMIETP